MVNPHTKGEMKRWGSDGETDIWEDGRWEKGLEVWEIINGDGKRSFA